MEALASRTRPRASRPCSLASLVVSAMASRTIGSTETSRNVPSRYVRMRSPRWGRGGRAGAAVLADAAAVKGASGRPEDYQANPEPRTKKAEQKVDGLPLVFP